MQINTEQLSQTIDLTLETGMYSAGLHTIISGLDSLNYTEEAVALEELWEDVHPETLEGYQDVINYLEGLNEFMYQEAQHDSAVSAYQEGTLENTTTGDDIPW